MHSKCASRSFVPSHIHLDREPTPCLVSVWLATYPASDGCWFETLADRRTQCAYHLSGFWIISCASLPSSRAECTHNLVATLSTDDCCWLDKLCPGVKLAAKYKWAPFGHDFAPSAVGATMIITVLIILFFGSTWAVFWMKYLPKYDQTDVKNQQNYHWQLIYIFFQKAIRITTIILWCCGHGGESPRQYFLAWRKNIVYELSKSMYELQSWSPLFPEWTTGSICDCIQSTWSAVYLLFKKMTLVLDPDGNERLQCLLVVCRLISTETTITMASGSKRGSA